MAFSAVVGVQRSSSPLFAHILQSFKPPLLFCPPSPSLPSSLAHNAVCLTRCLLFTAVCARQAKTNSS